VVRYQFLASRTGGVPHNCANTAVDTGEEGSKLDPEAANQEIIAELKILRRHGTAIEHDLQPLKLHQLILLEGEPDLRLLKVHHQLDALAELALEVVTQLPVSYVDKLESLEALQYHERLLPQLCRILHQVRSKCLHQAAMLSEAEGAATSLLSKPPQQMNI